jgi:hypothetical protein
MLGGQNGEEGKEVEDQISGEEDGAQDRQEKEGEEVTPRRCERLRTLSKGRSHWSARIERSAMRRHISPGQVDDGGRRRNRRSVPAGSALEPTCKSVSCLRKASCRTRRARPDAKPTGGGMILRGRVRHTPCFAACRARLCDRPRSSSLSPTPSVSRMAPCRSALALRSPVVRRLRVDAFGDPRTVRGPFVLPGFFPAGPRWSLRCGAG